MRFLLSFLFLCLGVAIAQPLGQLQQPLAGQGFAPLGQQQFLPQQQQFLPQQAFPQQQQLPLGAQQQFPIQQPVLGGAPLFGGISADQVQQLALQAGNPMLAQWARDQQSAILGRVGNVPPNIQQAISAAPGFGRAFNQQMAGPQLQNMLNLNPNLAQWMQQQQAFMQPGATQFPLQPGLAQQAPVMQQPIAQGPLVGGPSPLQQQQTIMQQPMQPMQAARPLQNTPLLPQNVVGPDYTLSAPPQLNAAGPGVQQPNINAPPAGPQAPRP